MFFAIENTGLEFLVNATDLKNKTFSTVLPRWKIKLPVRVIIDVDV
jgi:hypothetical protein